MFLAAAPYFYSRFQSDGWTATHFQPSILTVSSITNLGMVTILAKLQKNADYPRRIKIALLINIAIFTLLAFSTILFKNVSVKVYFSFVLLMVFGTSLATGFNQNGVFAYTAGFGREEYTQAIMGGQGVAGVLPCIVQIFSVLVVPADSKEQLPTESPKSAFIYFITATVISSFALITFLYLHNQRLAALDKFECEEEEEANDPVPELDHHKDVSLWALFKKLRWMALSVFICYGITMMFPVFTVQIDSVHDPHSSRLFQPSVFSPLAFFFWNAGDLIGRMSLIIPGFSISHRPFLLFLLSVARVAFIPLYLICNIRGRGPIVESDFFYLFIVQLLFGFTSGYIGSCAMVGAGEWVLGEEREAAGGFMIMMLCGGLAAGSVLSFCAASA